jgi:hypothetical protein
MSNARSPMLKSRGRLHGTVLDLPAHQGENRMLVELLVLGLLPEVTELVLGGRRVLPGGRR